MGGLSFTKTVISKIVSSSLSEEEVASGMSLLNFTSFLSEGTGIAIVGGLLSLQLINRKLVLEFINYSSGVYSNILVRSEEHTSELQSRFDLVCRLLLEKKK